MLVWQCCYLMFLLFFLLVFCVLCFGVVYVFVCLSSQLWNDFSGLLWLNFVGYMRQYVELLMVVVLYGMMSLSCCNCFLMKNFGMSVMLSLVVVVLISIVCSLQCMFCIVWMFLMLCVLNYCVYVLGCVVECSSGYVSRFLMCLIGLFSSVGEQIGMIFLLNRQLDDVLGYVGLLQWIVVLKCVFLNENRLVWLFMFMCMLGV